MTIWPLPTSRNTDGITGIGSSTGATTSLPVPDNVALDLFTKPPPSVPTQLPNGYPKTPSLSLELETDDSTSSDEATANPFNPDPAVSDTDNEPGHDGDPQRRSSTSLRHDRRREFLGSPHPAPSADGSTATPSMNLPHLPATHSVRSGSEAGPGSGASAPQEIVPPPVTRSGAQTQTSRSPPEPGSKTFPSSRSNKDKKPPPPPRSHHGRRISTTTDATAHATVNAASSSSHTSPPPSSNRLSYHASSPESQIPTRRLGTPNASLASGAGLDYFSFSVSSEDQQRARALESTQSSEVVQRSTSQHSQHKRPPTPPLSRRHSQMRRSKSTQSKSSGSRPTMSSRDSESTDSSQPPSPGPSTRSAASSISDRKRLSMPPPASRPRESDVESRAPGQSLPPDSLSPPLTTIRSNPPPPGRRASSHGSILTGSSPSSAAPPPPPPPRRARDSSSRNSDGRPVSQVIAVGAAPLPQPSNAQDILADLSRLQKEVDDLRGHYESRKVSQ